MVGLGRAEGLPDDSCGGGRSGWEGRNLRASRLPGLTSGMGTDTGVRFRGAGTGGRFRGAGTGGRSGEAKLAGTSGDKGDSGDDGGLDLGSVALPGPNSGNGALSPSLWDNPHAILSSPSAAVQGAPLRAHTVRGILPQGGRCCRLTHLD